MNIGKSIKNVGSKATGSATSKAQKVATGGNRTSSILSAPSIQRPMRRRIHPGSSAGLQNRKSVHLNMNGVGYLNPANQTARYSKKTINKPGIDILTSAGFARQNRTIDTRVHGSSCGSVKLLRERL